MVTIYIKPDSFVKHNGVVEFYKYKINENGEREYIDHYIESGFTKVELKDEYFDCVKEDFNEDLTFNIEKYNARKEQEKQVMYESEIIALIRKKYTIDQELAILRQRDTKPQEFDLYNDYVEDCKKQVKEKFNALPEQSE
jgi:hypothetical protein